AHRRAPHDQADDQQDDEDLDQRHAALVRPTRPPSTRAQLCEQHRHDVDLSEPDQLFSSSDPSPRSSSQELMSSSVPASPSLPAEEMSTGPCSPGHLIT